MFLGSSVKQAQTYKIIVLVNYETKGHKWDILTY